MALAGRRSAELVEAFKLGGAKEMKLAVLDGLARRRDRGRRHPPRPVVADCVGLGSRPKPEEKLVPVRHSERLRISFAGVGCCERHSCVAPRVEVHRNLQLIIRAELKTNRTHSSRCW